MYDAVKITNRINKIVNLVLFLLILVLIILLIGKGFNSDKPKFTVFKINKINSDKSTEIILEATDKFGLNNLVLQIKEQKIITECKRQKICYRNLIINDFPQTPSKFITLIATATNINGITISKERTIEISKEQKKACQEVSDCGELNDCGESWLCLEGFCEAEFKTCSNAEVNSTSTPELY